MTKPCTLERSGDTRNHALADAVNDITAYITTRLAAYQAATGNTVDYHMIALDGDMMETSSAISDFEMMSDAMDENVRTWLNDGLMSLAEDDDPLFTATFDATKVRPS